MIRSRAAAMLIAALTVALALAGPAAANPMLQFDLVSPTGGSVSYAGGSAPLVGVGIAVDTILGVDTPANNGVLSTCVSCTLAFTTGSRTSFNGTTWFFGGGGSITLTGGVDFLDLTPDIATGSTLFSGSWTSAQVSRVGTSFNISGGSFTDTKNDDLRAFYGVGANDWFGNFSLTFTSTGGASGGAFTSTTDGLITGVILNTVAEPPMLAVLGTLLVGLGLWGRGHRARTFLGV